MISKEYRLNERECKKVLQKGKPFFSYGIVLNSYINKLEFNRFGIVIGSKSVNSNVTRNFFRRCFYEKVRLLINKNRKNPKGGSKDLKYFDYVFVVKKQTKLDKREEKTIISFEKDLDFVIKKSFS